MGRSSQSEDQKNCNTGDRLVILFDQRLFEAEANRLISNISELIRELNKITDDKSMDMCLRNKAGVMLHSKIERCRDELKRLHKNDVVRLGDSLPLECSESFKTAKMMLLYLTRRTLAEIFAIEDCEPVVL